MKTITSEPFGKTSDGRECILFTMKNKNNLLLKVTNYGGIVTTLMVPDRKGDFENIVLGCSTIEEYEKNNAYLGALIGRFANRIANGRFTLEGEEYRLNQNDGDNTLHGGGDGFERVVWDAKEVDHEKGIALQLSHQCPDGKGGFPGNLAVIVNYILTDENEFIIEYRATTDKITVLNLTQHSYFNLLGTGDILGHDLKLNADHYIPVNEKLIPTGELESVQGTPLDFTDFHSIGERIDEKHIQLELARGYDHTWVLDSKSKRGAAVDGSVVESKSGRAIDFYTTCPGVQFYSGNFLDGSIQGPNGETYKKREGFCLETQFFPDSPNQPQFPSTVLKPGEEFFRTTTYRFYTV